MERHSSEEELERIAGIANTTGAEGGCRWHRHGELSSASSDEEVKDLCEPGVSPSPVLFSSSPPRGFKPTHTSTRLHTRPIILSHFEQPAVPYWRHRREPGRPSLDLEKMQQVCKFFLRLTLCHFYVLYLLECHENTLFLVKDSLFIETLIEIPFTFISV